MLLLCCSSSHARARTVLTFCLIPCFALPLFLACVQHQKPRNDALAGAHEGQKLRGLMGPPEDDVCTQTFCNFIDENEDFEVGSKFFVPPGTPDECREYCDSLFDPSDLEAKKGIVAQFSGSFRGGGRPSTFCRCSTDCVSLFDLSVVPDFDQEVVTFVPAKEKFDCGDAVPPPGF